MTAYLSCSYTFLSFFFFFNDTATTEIYTFSLHDALPISTQNIIERQLADEGLTRQDIGREKFLERTTQFVERTGGVRSEEHTSELQSHLNLVCRLLLEKKKKNTEKQDDNCRTD